MSRLAPLSRWKPLLLPAVLPMCVIVSRNWSWAAEQPGPTDLRPSLLGGSSAYFKGPFLQPRYLNARPGFESFVFPAGLAEPRFMTVDSQGHLYASVPRKGKILALPDDNGDGVADRTVVYASAPKRPHGLAFHGPDLMAAGSHKGQGRKKQ